MNPKELTVIEHIEELRKRLLLCAVFFVLALIVSFYLAKPIIKYIQYGEQAQQLTLNAFNVGDPLTVYLEVTFIVAFIITSPLILYQLWAFITPGLHETERKATLKYIPYAFVLFIVGLAFGYYILFPNVMNFMMNLSNELDIQQTIGINEYFGFLFKLVVPFGLIFELPVVTLFLARIGILDPSLMVKFRKYSYFVLFVVAVLVAPPDLISYILISIPLFVLYEISIFIARIGYKKYQAAEAIRIQEEKEQEQKNQVEELLAEQQRQIEEMTKQN
ncbi:twin-arginine translocase subunit TatC [Lysinibacillus yapensis]|uniref:Sec-independent protein translocase protein TatC n=1 Tax=Ureibacillus yapensis TaxID=2304605 RepID=A0A396S9Q1_9BACL|nr:twin-arginine translocase subunit TatC [Lysinibacillus yapensis]RHW32377.1 twin-arginine translocase subunit TatC [Lysinibacillus yapensis]